LKLALLIQQKLPVLQFKNAASIAGLLLTTEATIHEIPQGKKESGPPAPGGMGGMGGMPGMY